LPIKKYYIYSLVAAITIALCNFFILFSFQVANPFIISICLFTLAFFAYTLDHYYDGLKKSESNQFMQDRHQIPLKGFSFASKGFALSAIVSCYLFSFLDMPMLFIGLSLALLVAVYFWLVFKLNINARYKMLLSAFTLGLIMGAWIIFQPVFWLHKIGYLGIVILAVYANLSFFAWIDFEYDKKWFNTQLVKPLTVYQQVGSQIIIAVIIFFIGFLIGKGQSWFFIPLAYAIIGLFVQKKALEKPVMRYVIDLLMLLPILRIFW